MPKEPKLHEFDNDYLSYEEIAERTGLSYQSCLRLVAMGITSTKEAKEIIKSKPRRSRAEILAALPKVESAKPNLPSSSKVNKNAIVRIRHNELDRMLNYLARTSSTTCQAAFEEFIIYLYEGRLWGKEAQSNQEAIAAIKQRLIDNHNGRDNGESYEIAEPKAKPESLKGWQQKLIPYMEELESENAALKAKLAQLKAFFGEIE